MRDLNLKGDYIILSREGVSNSQFLRVFHERAVLVFSSLSFLLFIEEGLFLF